MHSPSRKFRDDGALLVDSVILGTNSRVRALRSTFANLGTQASQGFSSTAGLDSSLSAAVSSSAAARNGSGNTYVTIQQNVPPNADLAAVGKASVDAIDAYVRKTGRAPAFVQRKR